MVTRPSSSSGASLRPSSTAMSCSCADRLACSTQCGTSGRRRPAARPGERGLRCRAGAAHPWWRPAAAPRARLLHGGGLHGVVVRERGHRLDVGVGVTHHPVRPHGQHAEREQQGGEETGQRGQGRPKHREDPSDSSTGVPVALVNSTVSSPMAKFGVAPGRRRSPGVGLDIIHPQRPTPMMKRLLLATLATSLLMFTSRGGARRTPSLPDAVSQDFAGSQGGWTSDQHRRLCVPRALPDRHQQLGGGGADGNGYIRTGFATSSRRGPASRPASGRARRSPTTATPARSRDGAARPQHADGSHALLVASVLNDVDVPRGHRGPGHRDGRRARYRRPTSIERPRLGPVQPPR